MAQRGLNTYGDIGNQTAGFYVRQLLEHSMPVMVLERYGMTKMLPRHQTKLIEFRRSQPFSPATTPLSEGVPPSGSDFGYDSLSVQIQQYGDWTSITDVVHDTSKDMVLRDAAERQGEQIGETREQLTWDVLRAGTSVAYGGAVTSRAAVNNTALLNATAQRRVIANMEQQKARKLTKVLKGSTNYETFAIEPSFIAVGHTDMKPTLRDLSGANANDTFTPTARYGSSMSTTHPYEVGNFEDVRYVLSPDLGPFRGAGASSPASGFKGTNSKYDVYPMLYMGKNSWGCIALRGARSVRPYVNNLKPTKSDPLGQRGTIGWKMWFACAIFNEAWMQRLEVACKQ